MRRFISAAVLVCLPLTAFGQNLSTTVQVGEDNQQSTIQSGGNAALTMQFGINNISSINQNVQRNFAAVGQVGEGHVRTVDQTGHGIGYGSVQATHDYYSRSFSGTGGNGFTSTTLDIDVED
mgnify:FL=1